MAAVLTGKAKKDDDLLFYMRLSVSVLLAVFAVALQPDVSLLTGFWGIRVTPL